MRSLTPVSRFNGLLHDRDSLPIGDGRTPRGLETCVRRFRTVL